MTSSSSHTTGLSGLGVIGNGTFGAIIDKRGRYVWACPGHFGSDPIFSSLLNNDSEETGFQDIVLTDFVSSHQRYLPHSAILCTALTSGANDVVEIRDFAPRFQIFDRIHCPFQTFRILEPIHGDPQITIRIRPTFNYNSTDGFQTRGSHHIRYCGPRDTWRVTTNAPIASILEETPFLLQNRLFIIMGTDESLQSPICDVCLDFERKCLSYWNDWVTRLALPVEYQEVLIRASITLAVLNSEDQGGLVSSLTMGIPLASDAPASKDERVCRLYDECLSLSVLRNFGLFPIGRKFLEFLKNRVFSSSLPQLTYGIHTETSIPLERARYLAGYKGMGSVNIGGLSSGDDQQQGGADKQQPTHDSTAATHQHNGVIVEGGRGMRPLVGLLVIALAQVFYDPRLLPLSTHKLFERLEHLAGVAFSAFIEMQHAIQGVLQAEKIEASRSVRPPSHPAPPPAAAAAPAADTSAASAAGPEGWFDDEPRSLTVWEDEDDDFLRQIEHARSTMQALVTDMHSPPPPPPPAHNDTRRPHSRTPFPPPPPPPAHPHAYQHPQRRGNVAKRLPLVHTFSSVLCWAAAERIAQVSERLEQHEKKLQWWSRAKYMRETILTHAYNPHRQTFTTHWKGHSVGPSLLRLAEVGFISGSDVRFANTVRAFEQDAAMTCTCSYSALVSASLQLHCSQDPHTHEPGGSKDSTNKQQQQQQQQRQRPPLLNSSPTTTAAAASLCDSLKASATTFTTNTLLWYVEALRACGRAVEARLLFDSLLRSANECGLLSQSIDMKSGELWGNFPHAATCLSLIRCGTRLSRNWN